ncbi:MAG: glycosyltransferase family 39 protein [Polyangiaceae bacterium]|nr:glycosyltransferase family 39 protein [Polyangiaceae bacterium]
MNACVAIVTRILVLVWSWDRFPPAGDGVFFHRFAERLAAGEGYTVRWPDNVVTYAAHYPIGYPAILSGAYRVFGPSAHWAGVVNAAAFLVMSTVLFEVLCKRLHPHRALMVSCAFSLFPGLLFYTPAVMTETLASCLLFVAAAILVRADEREGKIASSAATPVLLAGGVLGMATLVRPQAILFALGVAVFSLPWARRAEALRRSIAVVGVAVLVCLPWTARNCVRMKDCSLVSVNAGWNLLIGTQTENGSWRGVGVPERCKSVWDEAEKDRCFRKEASLAIAEHPWTWLSKMPQKWAVTFDHFGAAGWYLEASNSTVFTKADRSRLDIAEIGFARLCLLAAVFGVFREKKRSLRADPWVFAMFALAVLSVFLRHAWVAYALMSMMALRSKLPWTRISGGAILLTMFLHGVFFGAGRYGLSIAPFVVVLAAISYERSARAEPMNENPEA